MKICAIICEYNPLHNGHIYLMQEAKKQNCPFLLCLMSGNFTQRGELAILDKATRAKHAILAGADIVLELPTVFSLSSAEFFAKGAISILKSIPNVKKIIFGSECASLQSLTACSTFQENIKFKSIITQFLKKGNSYIQSKTKTLKLLGFDEIANCSATANNILAIAYLKAIEQLHADIEPIAIQRKGGAYLDKTIYTNFSSATAIRHAVQQKNFDTIASNLPQFVLSDLYHLPSFERYYAIALYSILCNKKFFINIQDCTEGLENRLYFLAKNFLNYLDVIREATSKRYTTTRIQRIFANATLQIDKSLLFESFVNPLYLKVLAIKKSKKQQLLSILSRAKLPFILQQRDEEKLLPFAKKILAKDKLAENIYAMCSNTVTQKIQIIDKKRSFL